MLHRDPDHGMSGYVAHLLTAEKYGTAITERILIFTRCSERHFQSLRVNRMEKTGQFEA